MCVEAQEDTPRKVICSRVVFITSSGIILSGPHIASNNRERKSLDTEM